MADIENDLQVLQNEMNGYTDDTDPAFVIRMNITKKMYERIFGSDSTLFDRVLRPLIVANPSLSSREVMSYNAVQDDEEYQKRFRGNDARDVDDQLFPLEYIKLEETYANAMAQAGLPKGFYDSPDDFEDWIGKSVAPSEVQSRVAMAADAYTTVAANDPGTLRALAEQGVDRDYVMAYFLDPDKATPLVTKQSQLQAAKIQGTGYNFGIEMGADQSSQLANQGISVPEARERFRTVAAEKEDLSRLANLYGEGFTDSEQVADAFGMDGAEGFQAKKKKLASQERGKFSGTSGIKQGSLNQKEDNKDMCDEVSTVSDLCPKFLCLCDMVKKGGKDQCPRCFYLQPCCDGGQAREPEILEIPVSNHRRPRASKVLGAQYHLTAPVGFTNALQAPSGAS